MCMTLTSNQRNIGKRVSAIIIKAEKILLVHRIKDDKNYFVLPGGSVIENESNIDALIREVKEETGLDIKLDKELWIVNNEYDKRTQYTYLVSEYRGKLELGSHEKDRQSPNNKYILEWCNFADLKAILFYPSEIKEDILNIVL